MAVLLLLLAGAARRSQDLVRAGLLGLVLVALFAVPVYLSGKSGEHVVEHMPAVTERQIAPHEQAAAVALTLMLALGALALFGLLRSPGAPLPGWLMAAVLLLSLLTSGVALWTANLGGRIRHVETRPGFEVPRETGEAAKKERD